VISRLVASAGRLTVAWRPPGDTGGTRIVSYLVRATDNGPTTVCVTRRTVCTLTGLARRRTYLVRVVARSAVASSPSSAARRVRTSSRSSRDGCGVSGNTCRGAVPVAVFFGRGSRYAAHRGGMHGGLRLARRRRRTVTLWD
jgi:hypothetical protein